MTELLKRWPRIVGPDDGELLGSDGRFDRFMVGGAESAGRVALLEHRLGPRALAGPMHLHTREDEFSWILEGSVGAILAGREVIARPGELVIKPRGEWHTFWNAGDTPARLLEIIVPGGLEDLFRILDTSVDFDMTGLPDLAAKYGCQIDLEQTMALVESHRLNF